MASNYTETIWTNGSGQPVNQTNLGKLEKGVADASDGANIKTWYEAEPDTNAYTDAEKATLAQLDVDVTDHEARLVDLENTGLTVLSGNSLTPQSIGTSATKVTAFDSIDVDAGAGTSGDLVNQRAIADSAGVFKLRFEAFITYASNVDITWQIYKNGSPYGSSLTLSGQGATAFALVLISSANLLANDYLELYATASATTNITILQSNATLEKTHF